MAVFTRQFANRVEAAGLLCRELAAHDVGGALILGIPRGGVVIADVIARVLGCDLDIVLTRKIGAPGNRELAVGAVSEDGKLFINEEIAAEVGADDAYMAQEQTRQLEEIRVRHNRYRRVLPQAAPTGRTVVVVDDGVATGATMLATLWAVAAENPSRTIAAIPVGAPRVIDRLGREADEVVCLLATESLRSIGQFYETFEQVDDDEVLRILRAQRRRRSRSNGGRRASGRDPNHSG